MSIRREDKELIHNLAVLGALLGACLGVFGIMHLSNNAREQHARHSEYQQTHAALAKLGDPTGLPGELVVDKTVLEQVQQQIQSEEPEAVSEKESLWLKMPRWGFYGICGAGGIAGASAGFITIRLTGWVGSIMIYYFIRLLYRLICKVAPNSATAKSLMQPKPATTYGTVTITRDETRILPVVVKLLFLLALVLGVLGVVVWHLAGI